VVVASGSVVDVVDVVDVVVVLVVDVLVVVAGTVVVAMSTRCTGASCLLV
jgi:hypothetical protein